LGHVLALAKRPGPGPGKLRVVCAQVTNPRARRGVRHRLEAVLTAAVCAVLAGARSYTAVAEWAADVDPDTRATLGIIGPVPSESTFRRVLQRLDADRLDEVLGAWAAAASRPPAGRRRRVTVDGKTLRGSGGAGSPAHHLLAALDHDHGVVLAQLDVYAKTNEVPQLPVLLDTLEVAGVVVTADALHAQRSTADYLHGRGAHYVLTVKHNQPNLYAQLKGLPWTDVPVAARTRDGGHSRAKTRTVKVTAVRAGILFPHATQAIQVVRCRRTRTGRWRTETAYAVTSLAAEQADPAELADAIRGHWHVENRLH
jgi:predicted transposase YbfD/YdcC